MYHHLSMWNAIIYTSSAVIQCDAPKTKDRNLPSFHHLYLEIYIGGRTSRIQGRVYKCVFLCVTAYGNGGDSDSFHGGTSEQVPQSGADLCRRQLVRGARTRGRDVLYDFCSHVMNYKIILQDRRTHNHKAFILAMV